VDQAPSGQAHPQGNIARKLVTLFNVIDELQLGEIDYLAAQSFASSSFEENCTAMLSTKTFTSVADQRLRKCWSCSSWPPGI
jgi:hypothetical protein